MLSMMVAATVAELSVYSLMILLTGSIIFDTDGVTHITNVPAAAFLPLVSQAIGGIIVSQVTKHVGTVRKVA